MEIFMIIFATLIISILFIWIGEQYVNDFIGILGTILLALSLIGLIFGLLGLFNRSSIKSEYQIWKSQIPIIEESLKSNSMSFDTFNKIYENIKNYNNFIESNQILNKGWLDWWIPDEVENYKTLKFEYNGTIENK